MRRPWPALDRSATEEEKIHRTERLKKHFNHMVQLYILQIIKVNDEAASKQGTYK
jgi:hypothetical protein